MTFSDKLAWLFALSAALPGCSAGTPAPEEPPPQPAVVSNVVTVPARQADTASDQPEAGSEDDEPIAVTVPSEEAPQPEAPVAPTVAPASPPPRSDPAALAAARAHFQQGVRAYEEARYTDAKLAFEAAYGLAPMPQVLYNIATVDLRLGNTAGACRRFNEWKTKANPDPNRLQTASATFAVCRQP